MLLYKLDQPIAVGSASDVLDGAGDDLQNLPVVYAGGH